MPSGDNSGDSSAASDALTAPEVQAGETLNSSSSSYSVLYFIGEGHYGRIAESLNLRTNQKVAVKILKKDTEFAPNTEREVAILKVINQLNSDYTNMIKFFEQFQHMEQTCLVFEMLDRNLYDLLEQREWERLPLHEIRPIAKQLLVALVVLKGLNILHTDIKPDNVMLVNMQDQPLRVKLIDFGCAMTASQAELGMEIQPCGYRAPEICLGLPFTEAIDVWGVGCILAFLYLAENLLHVHCQYQMMKTLVFVLGQPEDPLLCAGMYSHLFFIEEEAEDGSSWRLMTAEEFTVANNMRQKERDSFIKLPDSLNGLIHIYPELEASEMEDCVAFVSLLEGLLHLDGDERISPLEALQQPFISMSHLREDDDSRDYLTTSQTAMRVCLAEDRVHFATPDTEYTGSEPSSSMEDVCLLSDASLDSISTTCSFGIKSICDTVSCGSDDVVNVVNVPAAATGGKRKLLRRMTRFFSSISSCFCPYVED